MKPLIDTHVFLWLRNAPEKISPKALQAYQNPENITYLSIASIWEMQIKHQLGKLELDLPLQELIENQCFHNDLQILSVEMQHIFALSTLPLHHKDPFDRLILAQAQQENLHLVSVDNVFKQYDIKLFW